VGTGGQRGLAHEPDGDWDMAGYGGGWFWQTTAEVVLFSPCVCDFGMRGSRSPGSASSPSTFAPVSNGHEQRRLVHGWAAEGGQRHERR